jgi:hypothetical protein
MLLARQTDLFEGKDNLSQAVARLTHLEKKFGNVQKGLFARHHKMASVQAELSAMVLELKDEMNKIKKMLPTNTPGESNGTRTTQDVREYEKILRPAF